jgi:hypothetical protein
MDITMLDLSDCEILAIRGQTCVTCRHLEKVKLPLFCGLVERGSFVSCKSLKEVTFAEGADLGSGSDAEPAVLANAAKLRPF